MLFRKSYPVLGHSEVNSFSNQLKRLGINVDSYKEIFLNGKLQEIVEKIDWNKKNALDNFISLASDLFSDIFKRKFELSATTEKPSGLKNILKQNKIFITIEKVAPPLSEKDKKIPKTAFNKIKNHWINHWENKFIELTAESKFSLHPDFRKILEKAFGSAHDLFKKFGQVNKNTDIAKLAEKTDFQLEMLRYLAENQFIKYDPSDLALERTHDKHRYLELSRNTKGININYRGCDIHQALLNSDKIEYVVSPPSGHIYDSNEFYRKLYVRDGKIKVTGNLHILEAVKGRHVRHGADCQVEELILSGRAELHLPFDARFSTIIAETGNNSYSPYKIYADTLHCAHLDVYGDLKVKAENFYPFQVLANSGLSVECTKRTSINYMYPGKTNEPKKIEISAPFAYIGSVQREQHKNNSIGENTLPIIIKAHDYFSPEPADRLTTITANAVNPEPNVTGTYFNFRKMKSISCFSQPEASYIPKKSGDKPMNLYHKAIDFAPKCEVMPVATITPAMIAHICLN